MSYQVIESDSLVELSTEEQQLLSGGCKDCGKVKYYHHHHHHHVHEFRFPKRKEKNCYDSDSD